MKCKNCGFNIYPEKWVHGAVNKQCSKPEPNEEESRLPINWRSHEEIIELVKSEKVKTAKEIKVWLIENDLLCEESCDECKNMKKDFKKQFLEEL